jgi:hypothetical protein
VLAEMRAKRLTKLVSGKLFAYLEQLMLRAYCIWKFRKDSIEAYMIAAETFIPEGVNLYTTEQRNEERTRTIVSQFTPFDEAKVRKASHFMFKKVLYAAHLGFYVWANWAKLMKLYGIEPVRRAP